ncbi:MAG: PH domain-containing protein [Propionibacteriaceae bacterium]
MSEWRQLDPRTVAASAILLIGGIGLSGLITAVILLIAGVEWPWALFTLGCGLVVGAAIAVGDWVRFRVTRWRVTPERVEKRVQFIGSSRSTLLRSRIRTVDLTASVLQRAFGITTVRLGTGEQQGADFTLQYVSVADAQRLHDDLMHLHEGADTEEGSLAVLDPRWIRYAPLGFAPPILALALLGGAVQVADWFSAVPGLWGWVAGLLAAPVGVTLLLIVVAAYLVGIIGSLLIFVEQWWGYRLDRRSNGALHVQRGLLVRRSITFEAERIRGVVLVEPPGIRRAGAARVDIVAVGLSRENDSNGNAAQSPIVLPPAPRALAIRVAADVLGRPLPDLDLMAHPPAARRRRFVRAAVFSGVLVLAGVGLALAVPALIGWVLAVVALLVVTALFIAHDNSRGLGHRLDPGLVTVRRGSLWRRTELLHRAGLLGWNLRQTPFQRRSGILTLVATSAAASGAFRLPDVSEEQAAGILPSAGPVWEHLTEPASTPIQVGN